MNIFKFIYVFQLSINEYLVKLKEICKIRSSSNLNLITLPNFVEKLINTVRLYNYNKEMLRL